MQLVSALAEGVTGADEGTAELYLQSDDSRAVYYLDHLGNARVSSGADVTLDSYGSACVYVDDIVRVVVKDQDGATVREFVDGCSAALVDYSGASATGNDYVTRASATSKPVTVQGFLNRWYTDAAGVDFLINGSTDVEDVADSVDRMVRTRVNIKAFGGTLLDGIVDNTEHLSEAIAFAASIGGVVFIPAGICKISESMVIPSGVTILGTGKGSTAIIQHRDSASALSFQSGTTVAGLASLRVKHNTTTAIKPLIQILPGAKVLIRDCKLEQSKRTIVAVVSGSNPILNASTELAVEDSVIDLQFCGIHDYRREAPSFLPVYRRCKFSGNAWATTMAEVAYGRFEDCVFAPGFGGGIGIGVQEPLGYAVPETESETAEEPRVIVRRCSFSNSPGLGASAFSLKMSSYEQSAGLFEDQNTFGGSVTPYQLLGSKRSNGRLGSSESRVVRTTSNATTVDIDVTAHTVVLTRTSSAAQAALIQSSADGAVRRLFVYNNSGGAITQTVRSVDGTDTGDFPLGAAGVAMANGTWRLWEWVQWPLETQLYSETETPEAHFAVICDGTAVGSPA